MKNNAKTKALFKQNKCCVLVPSYNNATLLEAVLDDVSRYCEEIIVVNDGSTDHTVDVVKKFPTIDLIGYEKNRGKGFAIRTGFKYALEKGFEYAITIDSDGQHMASDLPVFLDKLQEAPHSIIIGSRRMNQKNVPRKSNFGRKFSNFWFRLETGVELSDTQSGYRLYPIKVLSNMAFFTRKFEFEIEVIVRAIWNGIPVTEVPVDVFYPKKERRISHFRPVRDFSRISVLSALFVVLTILYYKPRDLLLRYKKVSLKKIIKEEIFGGQEPAHRISIAIGFGVFMGIVPIWGYQLIVGVILAQVFKINKTIFFIAANISLPPMIPFILYLSFVTGGLVMGKMSWAVNMDVSFDTITNNLTQYIAGSLILALVAGLLSGLLSYPLLRIFKKR